MKFATESVLITHFRHVATLPLEIKKKLQIFSRYGRKCKQILIKFSMSLFFYLFTFAINLWLQKFVTADVITLFINSQQTWYSASRTRFRQKVSILRGILQIG